jgi:hypothetical protein
MITHFVIDPPWPQRKGGLRKVTPNQTRDLDYLTLPMKEIFEVIELLYPGSGYMDVFSREKREGWEQWGDEIDRF